MAINLDIPTLTLLADISTPHMKAINEAVTAAFPLAHDPLSGGATATPRDAGSVNGADCHRATSGRSRS
jgi:hypothetical protein